MSKFNLSYYRQLRRDFVPAVAALASARRAVAFRTELSALVRAGQRRSAAARRGWKTRRAAA